MSGQKVGRLAGVRGEDERTDGADVWWTFLPLPNANVLAVLGMNMKPRNWFLFVVLMIIAAYVVSVGPVLCHFSRGGRCYIIGAEPVDSEPVIVRIYHPLVVVCRGTGLCSALDRYVELWRPKRLH